MTSTTTIGSMTTPSLKNLPTKTKAATKVYSYTRFSTAEQKKGRGQKRQTGLADAWCKANGYTLEQSYSDLGVSAFKSKHATHGDLSRFLAVIQSGRIRPGSVLLVESLDRLSRDNINLAVQLLLNIISSGVIVVTLIDNAVYRADAEPMTLMAQLMLSVAIFMRANDESRMKSARKGDSWQAKRVAAMETGAYHGGKTPSWIRVVDGKYQVIEEEAKIVRDLFTDYVHKGFGQYRLNAKHGIPRPTISYWLDNPVVTGTLTITENGAKVEIPNHYPAIIDMKTWKLARQRRSERYIKRRPGRIGKYVNLFVGLLTDPNGKRMIVSQHNGGIKNYTSLGHIVRCRYLEEVICAFKLTSKFVTLKEIADESPAEHAMLAKIESNMRQIEATMKAEPELTVSLLPALRELVKKRKAIAGKPKPIREVVDMGVVLNLLNDEQTIESRLMLKDIAQQSIQSIELTDIQNSNWYVMVAGVITTTDGDRVPFRYAYNTRREGFVMCDQKASTVGSAGLEGEDRHAMPVFASSVTDEVKTELKKLPFRGVTEEQQKKYWKRQSERMKAYYAEKAKKIDANRRRVAKLTAAGR